MISAAGIAGTLWPTETWAVAQAEKADKVVVVKSERQLYLLRQGQVLKSYKIALGRQPKGTKIYEGDGRTPEGTYSVAAFNPASQFYRAIRVSYPNESDRARARALGVSAGGLIMIHGLAPERRQFGADHYLYNWTSGCIAVTDREMDEIWERIELGTPIEIRP